MESEKGSVSEVTITSQEVTICSFSFLLTPKSQIKFITNYF